MNRRAASVLAVAILGAGAIAATVIVTRIGHTASVAETMKAAGCTDRDVAPYPPKDAATHNNYHDDFPTLSAKPHWSTFPPSAGGHYRLWAVWGFYRKAVNPAMVVHNEEHGGVVIWWGPGVPKSTIAQLERFYDEQPVGVFGTPIAGLGAKIALTAWTADPKWKGDEGLAFIHHDYGTGHIAVCSQFNEKAFAAFRNAYRGKSPQGFPLVADKPGCGPETSCPVS